MPPAPTPRGPITGIGILCVVIGIIVALPSGACTGILLVIAAVAIGEGDSFHSLLEAAVPMILLAIAPLAVGIVLIWVGLKQRRPVA